MKCPTPITIYEEKSDKYLSVPCNKCGACKSNRRADWSFRLKQELKNSKTASFITLSYSDENLYFNEGGIATLVKDDFQRFMKRLRKAQSKITDVKLRYYAVGEYGTKTWRPHYHLLLFNLIPELQPQLEKIWNQGFISISPITDARIHYATKFHLNVNNERFEYVDQKTGEILFDREPEFALMSRRPGIGANYIGMNQDWHKYNRYNYVINNGYKQRLPKYYKDKLFGKIEKDIMNVYSEINSLVNYKKEVERLRQLNIKNIDKKLFLDALRDAKNYKAKFIDNSTF